MSGELQPFADLEGAGHRSFRVEGGSTCIVGSRSAGSGVTCYPARTVCPETGARDMQPAEFGPHAVLYSFATVHVSVTRDVPYTIGYIDFPSGLRTLAHVRRQGDDLACDMPVVLKSDATSWWVEPERSRT
ncbi:hypothetical protein DXV76_00725 [Rhodobacteraceae bacterium CCMM004]|nr:hypothetical protein DXV76_00725 [Rhodobacteraceae bacterium CCMM004]